LTVKQHRQKVNTFHFPKVKQNGEPRPKNPPILPIAVGKIADLRPGAVDFEGLGGEAEADRCGLEGEKEAKENHRGRNPEGKGDGQQTQPQEDEGNAVTGGNFDNGRGESGGHGCNNGAKGWKYCSGWGMGNREWGMGNGEQGMGGELLGGNFGGENGGRKRGKWRAKDFCASGRLTPTPLHQAFKFQFFNHL